MTDDDRDLTRDKRILLAHVRGLAHPLAADIAGTLGPEEAARYQDLLRRRLAQEPVQYILGEWDFFGRRFRVDSRALIPRPETEHIVEEAVREAPHATNLLDLGCGSGILAITLALEFPQARAVAVDASLAALALCRENVRLHGVKDRVGLVASSWTRALANKRFDLAVANPPYIAENERPTLPASVRDFEPPEALFAGDDGLSEIRALLSALPPFLERGAAFLLEFGFGQKQLLDAEIGRHRAWRLVRFVDDLAGIARIAVLRRR